MGKMVKFCGLTKWFKSSKSIQKDKPAALPESGGDDFDVQCTSMYQLPMEDIIPATRCLHGLFFSLFLCCSSLDSAAAKQSRFSNVQYIHVHSISSVSSFRPRFTRKGLNVGCPHIVDNLVVRLVISNDVLSRCK